MVVAGMRDIKLKLITRQKARHVVMVVAGMRDIKLKLTTKLISPGDV